MKYKIILANIVFVFAMFPYISVFHLPFDIQPWALFAALALSLWLFCEDRFSFPIPLKILLCFALFASISFAYLLAKGDADIMIGIRSLAGYISIFIFAFVGYKTFFYLKTKCYLVGIGVWLLAVFSQFLFGAMTFASVLPRITTGGGRGFTALAPEPSFYAGLCVALLVLNEFFYLERKYGIKTYIISFLAILLQVILSYSGVGVMLLILFASAKLIELLFLKEEKTKKWLAAGAIILIIFSIALFFNNKMLGEKRAGEVLRQSIENPKALLQNDYSVSNRLMNPILGIYGGTIETKGLGFGIGSKEQALMPDWLSRLRGMQTRFGGKIEGGLVSAVYELGIVGIAFILTVLWIILTSFLRNRKMRPALLASAFAIFIPICIFGSMSFPLLGYILGIHLYYLYNNLL